MELILSSVIIILKAVFAIIAIVSAAVVTITAIIAVTAVITTAATTTVAAATAIAAVAAATAAIATVAAATAATAAAVATATAAITAAVAAATAAAWAIFSFFHHNGAAIEFRFIEIGNCGPCFVIIRHFHETETFRAVGGMVHNDLSRTYLAKRFEGRAQIVAFGFEVQLCNKNVHQKKFKK